MVDYTMLVEWGAWVICMIIASIAVLKGWNGWLELKRLELSAGQGQGGMDATSPAGRISLADLKQRVRRLEAIAEGIDLPDARGSRG